MSDPVIRLAEAEAAAVMARERLHITMTALQARLEPKRLARDTVADLREAGDVAASRAADAAGRNPGPLAGLVAVAGLFLARHRIVALVRGRRAATRDADAS